MAKEDKAKTEGEGAVGGEGAAAKIEIAPETQKEIDDLKAQLKLSNDARQEAETRASQSARVATAAASEVEDSNLQMVTNAISTVEANQATLKARYKEALSAQDHDAAADINLEMADNAAKLLQLKNGKTAMEEDKKKPKRQADDILLDDPVEKMARSLSPRSAAWVRAHPEYITDKKLNKAMLRAHEDAIDDGCAPNSDKYFDYVEKKLGVGKYAPDDQDKNNGDDDGAGEPPVSEAGKGQARKNGADDTKEAAPPAMPPNRGGGGGNARRLTTAQKEAAAESGLTEEQYAENLEKLRKEGRITTH